MDKSTRDHDSFKKSHAAIHDDEKQENQRKRGYVNRDSHCRDQENKNDLPFDIEQTSIRCHFIVSPHFPRQVN